MFTLSFIFEIVFLSGMISVLGEDQRNTTM